MSTLRHPDHVAATGGDVPASDSDDPPRSDIIRHVSGSRRSTWHDRQVAAAAADRSGDEWRYFGDVTDRWVSAMRRRGLAESTIANRVSLLNHWWHFCDFKPFTVRSWRKVDAFIDGRGHTVARRYYEVSSLHMFYRWAMREGLTRHDPTALVERPRLPVRLPRPIHDTDLTIALALSDGTMHAAIVLAATSGLRCVELCRLQWIDVTPTSLRLLGKGNRPRVVPLHTDGYAALELLDRPDEWVFPWRENRLGIGDRASQAINKFMRRAGVDATAHQLRHWCASQALAATGDLRAVQELLGHSSPATTAIYTALDPSRIAHVVNAIRLPVGAATQLALPLDPASSSAT